MVIQPLNAEKVTAYFDEENRVIRVAYNGDLDAEPAIQVYDWLLKLLQTVGVENINGSIFDFSGVTNFQDENLRTARKASRQMNMSVDTSDLPVALVVSNFYQEEVLHGAMRIKPEQVRRRIVHSMDEAISFIAHWTQERPTI